MMIINITKTSAEMVQSEDDPSIYYEDLEYIQISAGGIHSAGLTIEGRLFMWGNNTYGQLGDNTTTRKKTPTEITNHFNLNEGEKIIQVSVSNGNISAALTDTGRIFLWGLNNFGQIGDGTTNMKIIPTEITNKFSLNSGEKIIQVDLSKKHSAVLTNRGRVFTWGKNDYGQLGDGTKVDSLTPKEITNKFTLALDESIVKISINTNHSSALTSKGNLFTWGYNCCGQIGDNTYWGGKYTPKNITSYFNLNIGEKITDIDMGGYHSSAITSSGRMFIWGDNNVNYKQLSSSISSASKATPYNITNLFNLNQGEKILKVSLGWNNSSALTSDGRLFTWGGNQHGMLGMDRSVSKSISNIQGNFSLAENEKIKDISLGSGYAMALTTDGHIYTWGGNQDRQLGYDTTDTYTYMPKLVKTNSIIVKSITLDNGVYKDDQGLEYTLDDLSHTATIVGYTDVSSVEILKLSTYLYLEENETIYTVTKIGDEAFKSSTNIVEILIPNTVTHIGDSAFALCINLTHIKIPSSVVSIGNKAFYNCTNLTNVDIGDGVVSIGEYAFSNCFNLEAVNFGKSITTLGRGLFENCEYLTKIYFEGDKPKNENIGVYEGMVEPDKTSVFTSTKTLKIHYNDNANGWYGIDYSIIGWSSHHGWIKSNDGLDYNYQVLSKASILNAYQRDFQGIFYKLNYEDKTAIVGNDTTEHNNSQANGLREVIIPNVVIFEGVRYSVKTIGQYAFYGNQEIKTVIFNETKISNDLKEETIYINQINLNAFSECTNLEFIYFYSQKPTISGSAFANISQDAHIVYTQKYEENFKNDSSITGRKYKAFSLNEKNDDIINELKYELERSDESDKNYAVVSSHIGTERVVIIPEYVIKDEIMYRVTKLSRYAFFENDNITNITIGDFIGDDTDFGIQDCSLKGTSILEEISVSTYNKNYAAENGILFTLNEEGNKEKLLFVPTKLDLSSETYKVPDNVTIIESYAFYNHKLLKSIDLNAVQVIFEHAFDGASNLEAVTNLEVVQEIHDGAFQTTSITEVKLGSKLFLLGDQVFKDCQFITGFNVDPLNQKYFSKDRVLFGLNYENNITLIQYPTDYTTFDGKYTVPEKVGDKDVTVIAPYAFANSDLFEISLYNNNFSTKVYDNVKYIGEFAFLNCLYLTRVEIGASVLSIGSMDEQFDESFTVSDTFSGSNNLEKIIVHSYNENFYTDHNGVLFNIDQTILYVYPAGLLRVSYIVPETVKVIAVSAFRENDHIIQVVLPENLQVVRAFAFAYTDNLNMVYFKGDLPSFGDGVFPRRHDADISEEVLDLSIYYRKQFESNWSTLCATGFCSKYGNKFTVQEYNAIQEVPDQQHDIDTYTFIIVDGVGNVISDVDINFYTYIENDDTYTPYRTVRTNEEGMAVIALIDSFKLKDGKNTKIEITDSNGNYYKIVKENFELDLNMGLSYITLISTPSIQGVSCNGQDINSETVKVNVAEMSQITISVDAYNDPSVEIIQFALVQNGQIITSQNVSLYTNSSKEALRYNFTLPSYKFLLGTDISVMMKVVYNNEEKIIYDTLNIDIFNFSIGDTNFDLGLDDSFGINVDEDVPFIGGIPWDFNISGGDNLDITINGDTITVAINIAKKVPQDNYKKDDYYDVLNKIANAQNNQFANASKYGEETETSSNIELTLCGALEFKYTDTGIKVTKGQIYGTIQYTFSVGKTVAVGFVPVRLEVDLDIHSKLSLTIKSLSYDEELTFFENMGQNNLVQLEFGMSLTGRAGIGCKKASIGVYGRAGLDFVMNLYPNTMLTEITLYGDIGGYVKYDGFLVNFYKEFSLFAALDISGELVLYGEDNNGGYKWFPETNENQPASLFSLENYTLTSESNYESSDRWEMFEYDNKLYKVYLDNVSSTHKTYTDDYNYQKLVYSVFDKNPDIPDENKTWGAPIIIDKSSKKFTDEITNEIIKETFLTDCDYSIYQDGNYVYIVYTQMNKLIDAAIVEGTDTISSNASHVEVKVVVWNLEDNTKEFKSFTTEETYDMNVQIKKLNGVVTVVWVTNTENNIFGMKTPSDEDEVNASSTTSANQIWYSQFIGDSWTDASMLIGGLNTITDLTTGELNGLPYVTYITDSDCNIETTDDRNIWVIEIANDETIVNQANLINDEAGEYLGVQYFNGSFAIYNNYNLLKLNDINMDMTSIFNSVNYLLPTDYQVYYDSIGNSHIFYTSMEESYSNLYSITYDLIEERWGNPVLRYSTGVGSKTFIDYFTLDVDEFKFTVYSLNTNVVYSEVVSDENVDENVIIYETNSQMISTELDLSPDVSIDSVHYIYDDDKYNDDELNDMIYNPYLNSVTTTISVKFTNTSLVKVTDVSILITDPNGNMITDTMHNINCLPGETVNITFDLVDIELLNGDYIVTISDMSQIVLDTSTFDLSYSNINIDYKHVVYGNENYLLVKLTNNGYFTSGNTIINVYADIYYPNNKMDPLYSLDISKSTLDYTEYKYYLIELGPEFYENNTSGIVTIYCYSENEYNNFDNYRHISVSEVQKTFIDSDTLVNSSNLDKASLKFLDEIYEDNMVTFSENGNQFIGITDLVKDADYVQNGSNIEFTTTYLNSLSEGEHTLIFNFETSSGIQERYLVINIEFTKIVVKWVVDGEEIREIYDLGATPVPKELTEKKADAQYTYTFIGWDKEITEATEDITYTAQYSKVINEYTVTFYNEDGTTILGTTTVDYGTSASYNGETPTKASTAEYSYIFTKWDQDFSNITENMSVKATYSSVVNHYTYRFYDKDGHIIVMDTINFGETFKAPSMDVEIIEGGVKYTFVEFVGYSDEFMIKSNIDFHAIYTSAYIMTETEVSNLVDSLGTITLSSYDQLYQVYHQIKYYEDAYPTIYESFQEKVNAYNNLVFTIKQDHQVGVEFEKEVFGNVISMMNLMSVALYFRRKGWWF